VISLLSILFVVSWLFLVLGMAGGIWLAIQFKRLDRISTYSYTQRLVLFVSWPIHILMDDAWPYSREKRIARVTRVMFVLSLIGGGTLALLVVVLGSRT
jgi:hypothetical protein